MIKKSARLKANKKTKVRLKLTRKARSHLGALHKGFKLSLKVTTKDRAGNRKVTHKTMRVSFSHSGDKRKYQTAPERSGAVGFLSAGPAASGRRRSSGRAGSRRKIEAASGIGTRMQPWLAAYVGTSE